MRPSPARCERAIAYLKALVDDDDPAPVLTLGHESSPVLRELGNGLLVSYVVDEGQHFKLINNEELEADGLTIDELNDIALGNLADAANARGVEVHPYDSIFAVIAGGNFEASLLLVDDLWDRAFRQFVTGPYAVAIPARDILAFGDAGDPVARAQLRAVIGRAWPTADHLLSDHLFTRSHQGWTLLAD
jgi:hypothetical protein